MVEKERRVSERSLENLKLGAESRRQGKVRHNFTIMPETVQWLKGTGNASDTIDALVERFKNGNSTFNHTHDERVNNESVSEDVYKRIEELETELEQLRSLREQLDKEINQLHARNGDLDLQVTNLKEKLSQTSESDSVALPDLESVRDHIVSRWKVQKRAESKDRIKEALDKFIAEVRSQLTS